MTSAEIIDAINICSGTGFCEWCAFYKASAGKNRTCCEQLMAAARKMIRKQEAEIADLRAKVPGWNPITQNPPAVKMDVLLLSPCKDGTWRVDKGRWVYDHFLRGGRKRCTHWLPMPEEKR